jgi:hypothetical protein
MAGLAQWQCLPLLFGKILVRESKSLNCRDDTGRTFVSGVKVFVEATTVFLDSRYECQRLSKEFGAVLDCGLNSQR